MKQKIVSILIIACIGGIFYFSWLPNPDLNTETYLPSWLRDWSNVYFNLRTAVPFVALGFLMEFLADRRNMKTKYSLPIWIINTLLSFLIVSAAELGQYFSLHRHPDVMDVLFGVLGSICGAGLYHGFIKVLVLTKILDN